MDKLEKYIRDSREDFDKLSPPDHIWSQIHSELAEKTISSKRESKLVWMVAKIVAAFAIVLASGIVIGYYMNADGLHRNSGLEEYYAVEERFTDDINIKMAALRTYNVDPNVEKDLLQLDEVFDDLKRELVSGPNVNQDQIVQALIRNYEVKVDILERVLSRMSTEEIKPLEYKDLRNDSISM